MKIFQIGFNKCGTKSLSDFFSNNGYLSVHWDNYKWDNHFTQNLKENKPLLDGTNPHIVFWSDIGFVQRQFQIFAEQYPNSKFIYNIRDVEKWINSRDRQYKKHPKAFYDNFGFVTDNGLDSKDYWKSEWLYHKKVIEEYFVGEKGNRLLTFDIEKDNVNKIVEFLPELDFSALEFPHRNKGSLILNK